MLQEIITFDGGLSTKKSPHLISRNEAIICSNVDLEKGSLYPLNETSLETATKGKYLEYFDGEFISNEVEEDERFYVKYAGRLYWSNGTFGDYGIMRYDGTNSGVNAEAPSALNANQLNSIDIDDNETVNGMLTQGASYTYAFTVLDSDGIESAPVFKTLPNDGVVAGSNSSMELKISVSDWNAYFVGTDISSMNIYRIGGSNPTYNLVASDMTPNSPEVTTDGTYYYFYDSVADINVSRIELTTFDNTPPPVNLDMLVENNGTFFGVVGNKVYFSRTGTPEYWGTMDYVMLDATCTGLGVFADSIIAFTAFGAYRIDGYSRDTIQLSKLPYNQGCVNKDTVTNIDTYLIWVSKNGVCLYNGSEIQVITKQSIAWDEFARVGETTFDSFENESFSSGLGFEITFSKGYQDKYFGAYADGVMVIDLANGLKVSTIDLPNVQSLFYNEVDNILYLTVYEGNDYFVNAGNDAYIEEPDNNGDYYAVGAYIYVFEGSDDVKTATWKTGEIVDGSTNVTKHYRQVELEDTPESVEVFIDGTSKYYSEGKKKFNLPSSCFGKSIQFEVTTKTEIKSLKYQFSNLKA